MTPLNQAIDFLDQLQRRKWRWFGQVERRNIDHVGKKDVEVGATKKDVKRKGLSVDIV